MSGKHAMNHSWRIAVATGILGLVGIALVQTITGDVFHFGVRAATKAPSSPLHVERYPTSLLVDAGNATAVDYVLPQSVSELQRVGGPKDGNELESWVDHLGGAAGEGKVVGIKLGSSVPEALPILGVRARIVDKRPPIAGTLVVLGAGPLDTKPVIIDLDSSNTAGVAAVSPGEAEWKFPLQVGYGTDAELISVYVQSQKYLVHYFIDVDYFYHGTTHTFELSDHGHPFSVTGTSGAKEQAGIGGTDPNSNLSITDDGPVATRP